MSYIKVHLQSQNFFLINGPIWNFEFRTQSKFSACRISRIEQIAYHCWSSWFVWNQIATVSLQVSLGIWVSLMTSHQSNWICAWCDLQSGWSLVNSELQQFSTTILDLNSLVKNPASTQWMFYRQANWFCRTLIFLLHQLLLMCYEFDYLWFRCNIDLQCSRFCT
jgi:hypothetical protein